MNEEVPKQETRLRHTESTVTHRTHQQPKNGTDSTDGSPATENSSLSNSQIDQKFPFNGHSNSEIRIYFLMALFVSIVIPSQYSFIISNVIIESKSI
jgi:hypothetical protein